MLSDVIVSILMLLFIYLLLALITNQIVNYIQEILSWRANMLERGIFNMLGEQFTHLFYEHPFIKSLEFAHRKPSYIPPEVFSSVLLDILVLRATGANAFEDSSSLDVLSDKEKLDKLYEYIKGRSIALSFSILFLSILNSSGGSLVKVRVELENHYNNMVEGLSATYRRRAQLVVLLVAMVLAIVLNIDSIALFNNLFVGAGINSFPIGWSSPTVPGSFQEWILKTNGLILTGFIVSVISPFWFNLQRILSQLTVGRRRGDVAAAIDVIKQAEAQNVQAVAASQIELLDEYHKIVLDQSRRSFVSALVAAIFGLGFFLGAVIAILSSNNLEVAIISILSGALVEVISGVNFYLYARTTEQMADFQSRLDMTQRFLLANSICENLEGEFKQNTRSQLVLKIVEPSAKATETPQS